MEIVDVEETESENPMGWFYMVYTARRDVVEVEYQKGYDTLTIGDPVGGFYPKKTESWNRLNEGESIVAHVNVEWYPVFQLVATDSIYEGTLPLGWDIYTSGQSNDGVPAPLSMTGLIINTPISLYKCDEHLTDGFSSPDLEYGYYSHVDYFLTDSEHPAHCIIGSAVLKEGTPVRALRTNDWDALDIIDQSGNIWRLNMEMSETNGYGITIDGRSPDELFEGLILIWGGNDG